MFTDEQVNHIGCPPRTVCPCSGPSQPTVSPSDGRQVATLSCPLFFLDKDYGPERVSDMPKWTQRSGSRAGAGPGVQRR